MKRVWGAVAALSLTASLVSCSALGIEPERQDKPRGRLETTHLVVSIPPTPDTAPYHLANKEGYFKDEGITVDFVGVDNGDKSVGKLIAGEVDIAFASYPSFFLAESRKAAQGKGGIKLVADASSAQPGSAVVLAMPDSRVKSMLDMPGKTVAYTGPGSISELLVRSTLKYNYLDDKDVKFVQVPFPAIPNVLKNHQVDAAFAVDPFIQLSEVVAGAVPLFDAATGSLADIPTAGWGSTGNFVAQHKNTIAAFQRAMQKATDLALTDRSKVEPILVEFAHVDADTAKRATFPLFQSKLDATRIQRVPDLMREFGVLKTPLDVLKAKMIVAAPSEG